jgi:DUF4097 and DUF4098 domain-containing protein YvlB
MKTRTKVILIIGLCLLLLGGMMATAGYALGGANAFFEWNGKGLELVSYGTGDNSSGVETEDFNLGKIKNISVDVDRAEVQFMPSDQLGVKIGYSGEANRITYQVSEDTLTISGSGHTGAVFSFGAFRSAQVIVYLPEDLLLETVSVYNGSGDVQINGLSAEKLDVVCDLGDVDLEQVSATFLSVSNDAGDTSLTTTSVQLLSVEMSLGDLELEKITSEQVNCIDVDSGDITMTECDLGDILEMNCDLGSIQGENITTSSFYAECDTGDIDLSGSITGKTDLNCDLGSVSLDVNGRKNDYSYQLETELGTVQVDNEKGNAYQTGDTSNSIRVMVDTGDIELNFR